MNQADTSNVATAPDFPKRMPTSWLNYHGDQRHILNDGPKGPNTLGEFLYPVVAEYDDDNQATRVGFSLIAPTLTA